MKRRVPLILSLVLLAAVASSVHTDSPSSVAAKNTLTAPGTNAGLTIYIDPATNKPVQEPIQPYLAVPPVGDDLNLSDEGLVLEDSPVSGKMVNLQGRFRHHYTAGVEADGEVTAHCDLPKSDANDDPNSEEE